MEKIREAGTFLLYGAIFDAYLIAAEYLDKKEHRELLAKVKSLDKYRPHPENKVSAGKYTDDTQMSIAVAKVIGAHQAPFSKLEFAEAFVAEFKHDPRPGYANGFYKFLQSVRDGKDFLARIEPHSRKNGAAMRSVPLGAIKNIYAALETAKVQASLTHDSEEGIFSSQIVTAMAHFAFYEKDSFSKLPGYCLNFFPQKIRQKYGFVLHADYPEDFPPGKWHYGFSPAITTVHAVADIVKKEPTMPEAMRRIIDLGGDTDTVGAIVGQLLGIRISGIPEGNNDNTPLPTSGLPSFMFEGLEKGNNRAGFEYLLRVGREFIEKMSKQ